MWFDEGSEPAEWKFFVLLYFLAYDRVEIYESKNMGKTCGQTPFPLFLGKIRLPKDWSNLPRKYWFFKNIFKIVYNIIT